MSESVALAGSAFHFAGSPRPGHHRTREITSAEASEEIGLTLLLREKPVGPSTAQSLAWLQSRAPHARSHLNLSQLQAQHGFAESDRDRVARWAAANGLGVEGDDPATRRMVVRGEAGRLAELFGVRLERFRWEKRAGAAVEYRGHAGPVRIPAAFEGVITGVFGLDNRPVATPRIRALSKARQALVTYDPPQLASIYRYPALPNDGEGVELVAGMIELGGVAHAFDLAAAFARLGLAPPDIVNVWLDGSQPLSDPDGADVEVALDYQVLGAMVMAMAPKAHLTIVVYNAPNHERGFVDAIATAASDAKRRPAAVSISWGAPEDHWSVQGMRAMDAMFAGGALHGVTYSAAAGDAGSSNAETDSRQHAEFPASSPHVWACGGTTLLATRDRALSETVWNELSDGAGGAGSGVSRVFATPAYQASNGIRPRSADDATLGRGLPDGSGNADPLTGWNVVALRRLRTTGGTSAVAPMYTALWTLVAALRGGPLGLPHPALYAGRGRAFHDIVRGNTGGPYAAARGWDTASGWGSPHGVKIARELGVERRVLRPPVTATAPRHRTRGATEVGIV